MHLKVFFLLLSFILAFYIPFLQPGLIVFSDISVGTDISRYMEEIFGLWNDRYNTTTMLNLPRLIIVLPSYIIATLFGAEWLTKSFVIFMSLIAAYSQYYFTYYLFKTYIHEKLTDKTIILSSIIAAIFYSISPWYIVRIQHTYLLCGYALFPLIIHFYLKIYNEKYQNSDKSMRGYIVLATIISLASAAIHYFFFVAITLGFLISFGLLKKIKTSLLLKTDTMRNRLKIVFKELNKTIVLGVLTLLSCLYWLFPYLYTAATGKMVSQANINVEDTLLMFSRASDLWSVLTGNSYWWSMISSEQKWTHFSLSWSILLVILLVGFLRYFQKNDLIKLFVSVSLALVLISVGTYYPLFAPIHEFMVFKIPVIGNMFRDPNKLIGVQMFFYSTFLALGFSLLFSVNNKVLNYLSCIVFAVSLFFITKPYYETFMLNYYYPTQIPESVNNMNDQLNDGESKVLFFPQAEDRVDRRMQVASLLWNENSADKKVGKSVGDIYLFGSKKNTTFQYEGNLPLVGYQKRYINNLIDNAKTFNLKKILDNMYVDQLVVQKGYSSFHEKEEFNKAIFAKQKGLTLSSESEYLDIYNTGLGEKVASHNYSLIATPDGIDRQINYAMRTNNLINDSNIVYTHQDQNSLDKIKSSDLTFDYIKYDDLWLSFVKNKHRINPFSFINRAMPFLGWAKTSIYKNEWNWFLQSMNIENRSFSVERSDGVIATFADSRLRTKAYDLLGIKGELYTDLRSLVSQEDIFVSNEDKYIEVQVHPDADNKEPLALGTISPGPLTKIWRVAKTKKIPVKAANPYSVITGISGKNASSVHIKVHFYDKNDNELSVAYMSRPDQRANFMRVNFKTFFVSPIDAKTMNISILSARRPTQRVYWWLHEFTINDLQKHKEENTVTVKHDVERGKKHLVYVRHFVSPKSKKVELKFDDENTYEIDTSAQNYGRFKWTFIRDYTPSTDKSEIIIKNVSGFNALGDIVIIPEDEMVSLQKKIEQKVSESKRILTAEAEIDFKESKILQSTRNFPQLSGGKGKYLVNQDLELDFDISKLRNGSFNLNGFNLDGQSVLAELIFKNKNNTTNDRLSFKPQKTDQFQKAYFVEKEEGLTVNRLDEFSEPVRTGPLVSKQLTLKPGSYTLKVKNPRKLESLSSTRQLRKLHTMFTPMKEVIEKKSRPENFCQCEEVDPLNRGGYRNGIKSWAVYSKNTCAWHVIQSNVIDVHPDNEYYLEFDYLKKNTYKAHQELVFLDKNFVEIGNRYIHLYEIEKDSDWINKKDLFSPPPNTAKMILVFKFKGVYQRSTDFKVKGLKVINYSKLPLLDFISFDENNLQQVPQTEITSFKEKSMMAKSIELQKSSAKGESVNFTHTFHKIWQNKNDLPDEYLVNGVFHAFNLKDGLNEIRVEIGIRFMYWVGLAIHCIFLLLILWFATRKKIAALISKKP